MWNHIDTFLNEIASAFKFERSDLYLVAERRTSGPTVQPGPTSAENIDALVEVRGPEDVPKMPSPWYDSIKSRHIEYRVIHEQSRGDVTIPRTVYSFQHHTFPGNCRIVVNRWVETHGTTWSPELKLAGLRFRARLAKGPAQARVLVISTGNSFAGAEPYEAYGLPIFDATGRRIYALALDDFLSGSKAATA